MSTTDNIYNEDLAELADICGEDVVLELMAVLPGIEFKVPVFWSDASQVAKLRRETAEILIKTVPGLKIYVPTKPSAKLNRENAIKLNKKGYSTYDIAVTLGLSERHVRHILNDAHVPFKQIKHDPRQYNFDDLLKNKRSGE